jgi:hypothetical protein
MTTPFTYVITHLPSKKRYYGVRYKEGCDPSELWTSYFTSSGVIEELRNHYGDCAFVFEIRRTFDTPERALRWEHTVLRRLKAASNDLWLNKHNGGSDFRFCKGAISEESRCIKNKHVAERRIGTKWYKNPSTGKTINLGPEDAIPEGFVPGMFKKSNGLKGRKLPEHVKQLVREARIGKPLSEQHKQKLSSARKKNGWRLGDDGRRQFYKIEE